MKISTKTLNFIIGGVGCFLIGWFREGEKIYKKQCKEQEELMDDMRESLIMGTDALESLENCLEELHEEILNSDLLSEEQKTEFELQKTLFMAQK